MTNPQRKNRRNLVEPLREWRFTSAAERWQAVQQRNHQARGAFVYGVLTTSVYCRPGCTSRLPKFENVRFFDRAEDAERAGFRPCKRCRPNLAGEHDNQVAAIVRACGIIKEQSDPPALGSLAAAVGLSPYHFQRLFKKIVGVTPKQYAMENRLKQVRSNLRKDSTVTGSFYDAGFGSSSRFYENASSALGMRPTQYRDGAQGIEIRATVSKSYLGWVLIAATERGICAIDLGDDPRALRKDLSERFPKARVRENDARFERWVTRILDHIDRPRRSLALPLDIQGTAFQRRVWMALTEIPLGSTASYSDIAARIGRPKASRAVARACSSNRIAIGIPCHRVVRRDGNLGGYRWGVRRKRALLERESARKKP